MVRKLTIVLLGAVLGLAVVANAQELEATPDGHHFALPYRPAPTKQMSGGLHVRYTPGDVFVAVGNGRVQEFTPAGVLVQTLDDTTGSTYTAGMAFDQQGNLYVTNFSAGIISKFDVNGNLVAADFAGTGQVSPESISMPGGLFPMLVGDADLHTANGDGVISQYNSNGVLLNTWTVAVENRGTDWVDLQPDLQTVLYTSEGDSVLSYNIATGTQNPDFATGFPGDYAYAHRTLNSGQYSGDDLVADSENALLVSHVSGILQTYILPGNFGEDFALNLSQDGRSLWTADLSSGEVWQVDIASGTILNQWNSGAPDYTGGLAIFQESGQGVPPCAVHCQ